MKWVMIIGAAVALIAGGFFGWTQYAGDDAFAISFEGEEEVDLVTVDLEALTVPFVREGKFAHYVVLVVSLQVNGQDRATLVRGQIPRLRDSFVEGLHALAIRRSANQTVISIPRIRSTLIASSEKVMGPGVITDILVQLAHYTNRP